MESVYEICFYGGLILAILLLIVSIVLFVVLKIPKVFGDLTGRTAKKSIKEMKAGKPVKESVAKKEQAKYYNQDSGKIKVRETVSTETRKENRDDTTDLLRPEELNINAEETEVLGATISKVDVEETEVLSQGRTAETYEDSTEVLSSEEKESDDDSTEVLVAEDESTEVLTVEDDATDILTEEDDATDILKEDMDSETDVLRDESAMDEGGATTVLTAAVVDKLSKKVKVEYNIVVTHTDESL
ncbi:MAG: hypothetical protein IJX12_06940 [Lachnospiraceae bacterium]|nr:hypothetical protein [Lachnospiraceae bacterium]